MSSVSLRFPAGFLWGAATSAYQIEGSPLADGAGPSIWHRFSHTPGRIVTGETGDVASDHYRRWQEDVELMAGLGLRAYRFSISWSRVLPAGTGAVNQAGLSFYVRLVDRLLENGILPFPTLYHWDLPAALDDRGGWTNPDVEGWFAEYAETVFRALGDRVPFWATLNEPWVVADAGYLHGVHAPGRADPFAAPRASHGLLRAHAAAVRAYRRGGYPGKIGIVVNLEPKHPASDSELDRAAAARADAYMNRQYLDPLFGRGYPEELPSIFGEAWPGYGARELHGVDEPLDFLGINYYSRAVVRHDGEARSPLASWLLRASPVRQSHARHTDMGWEIYPAGLTETLAWVRDRYGPVPIYVTENGAALPDPPSAGVARVLDDPLRVAYLREHLQAACDAIDRGVDLRGYFVWSLLDNYEWTCGTSMRFGIVHVDFETQKRTPKASALFYRDVIRSAATPEPAA